jgi:uncharacterized membrane protein
MAKEAEVKSEAEAKKTETKSEPKAKEATRVITLEDIKFNEANKGMAIVSCIPIVGAIIFFIEKKDFFVRYYAAQFGSLIIVGIALTIMMAIPVLNILVACLLPIFSIAVFVLMIVGMVKASNGNRFDIPVISDLALKMMNSIQ